MNIEQEIRAQIEKNRGLKLAVGEINNHLSVLEGLLRNERDDAQKRVDEAYQRGREDGRTETWWAARKIVLSPDEGGTSLPTLFAIFGCGSMQQAFRKNSASEAIEKLKAYEEQKAKDEIKVGDEVETKDGKRFAVTTFGSSLDGDIAVGICADGLGLGVDLKELRKTGRHFDIEKILEEMKA